MYVSIVFCQSLHVGVCLCMCPLLLSSSLSSKWLGLENQLRFNGNACISPFTSEACEVFVRGASASLGSYICGSPAPSPPILTKPLGNTVDQALGKATIELGRLGCMGPSYNHCCV